MNSDIPGSNSIPLFAGKHPGFLDDGMDDWGEQDDFGEVHGWENPTDPWGDDDLDEDDLDEDDLDEDEDEDEDYDPFDGEEDGFGLADDDEDDEWN